MIGASQRLRVAAGRGNCFMPIKTSSLGIVLLTVAGSHWAQAASPPKLDELLTQAELHAPRVVAAKAAVDAAAASYRAAGGWANPEISYSREDIGTAEPSRTVELRQRIELGGKIGLRQQIASAEERKVQLALRQVRHDVRSEVYRAYYDLSLSELRIREARVGAQVAQNFSTVVEKKLSAGRVPPVEAAKAKLPAILANEDLHNAERLHGVAILKLEKLIGQALPESDHPLPDLPRPPLPWEKVAEHFRQSPQTLMNAAQVDIQMAELASQKAQYWPDLILSGGVKNIPAASTSSRQFGIALEIPLFGRNSAKVAGASARLQQIRADTEAAAINSELQLQSLHAELQSLVERIRLYQETVIPTAESVYQIAQQGYELGRYSFIDILDAQRSLLTTRSERTSLWQQYINQQAEFDRLLGRAGSTSNQ
ncbi:TolC family protein [Chitinimonas arctica]|uniref:TolC family protein n=1 Tax=Chitinimonas arctica TaxID=2594795 RepID=A0A516SFW6_9NEIS|nr:TolC family protein [Chitinimonas arctica]QDQ27044.1 TolC family protein [Chitinimonas arctica]